MSAQFKKNKYWGDELRWVGWAQVIQSLSGHAKEHELYFKCYGTPQMDEGMNEQENELMNKPIAHLPECKGTQYSHI